MVSKKVEIKNPAGLYLNFAGHLCKAAMDYKASIQLNTVSSIINAKSILNVLGADIKYKDIVEVVCDGNDEVEALNTIASILEKEFIEDAK